MSDFAGTINESAVVHRQAPDTQIAMGLVGWPGEDDIVDMGTDDNDGASMLRVTLHIGGQPGDEPKPGEASGYRVSVRIPGPVYHVPAKGTEVIVAFPSGVGICPGAGVLLGTLARTPNHQFSETALKIDAGTDRDLILKGRAVTLTMHSPTGSGPEPYISITPEDGIQALDADGFGFLVKDQCVLLFAPAEDGTAKTIVRLTKEQLSLGNLDAGDGASGITLKDQEVCLAGLVTNSFTPGANIGALATAATPAMVGTGGPATWAAWLTALGTWATSVSAAFAAATPAVTVVFPPMPPPPCAPSVTVNVQP